MFTTMGKHFLLEQQPAMNTVKSAFGLGHEGGKEKG